MVLFYVLMQIIDLRDLMYVQFMSQFSKFRLVITFSFQSSYKAFMCTMLQKYMHVFIYWAIFKYVKKPWGVTF